MEDWWKEYFNKYYSITSFALGAKTTVAVDFILKTAQLKPKSSILDMCCGDGHHAMQFANKDMIVTGVDYSSVLIEKAKKKCEGQAPADFVCGDMRSFVSDTLFDLSYCIGGLGFFSTDEDNLGSINTLANTVKPGGHIILEHQNPHSYIGKGELSADFKFPGRISIQDKRMYNEDRKGIEITREIFNNNEYLETSSQFIRLFTKEELFRVLEGKGFEIKGFYGSFQGEEYEEKSSGIIVHAVRS